MNVKLSWMLSWVECCRSPQEKDSFVIDQWSLEVFSFLKETFLIFLSGSLGGALASRWQDEIRHVSHLSGKHLWRMKKWWSRKRREKHSHCFADWMPAKGDKEIGSVVDEEPQIPVQLWEVSARCTGNPGSKAASSGNPIQGREALIHYLNIGREHTGESMASA